jgi:pantetheine-phosphate adenylyltransferase
MKAIYPGSFDPLTCGHLDIIQRASRCYDDLHVVVFENVSKNPMFTLEERLQFLKEATSNLPNVQVGCSEGLLVDYAQELGANIIVKGLRAVSDFDYEFKMALMNKKLNPNIETVFMITELDYLYLSSSLVKEIASYGAPIKGLVPPSIEERVMKRINELRK